MASKFICFSCNEQFAELDNPLKCDSCSSLVHNKCSGLSATELKCLGLKNRILKFFCASCDQGLKELPELKTLIKKLLVDVDNIKNITINNTNSTDNINFSNEFVINEINERNRRANNLIFYNIEESDSNRSDDRITSDFNHINNIISIILSDISRDIPIPLKVIRLGRYQPGKMRPIKTIFSTATDVFDIIRNKKKITHSNLPSIINISTDRTPNQRESMKKLREELASRTNNGETGLTIKFQRGVPKIIKIMARVDARGNYLRLGLGIHSENNKLNTDLPESMLKNTTISESDSILLDDVECNDNLEFCYVHDPNYIETYLKLSPFIDGVTDYISGFIARKVAK
ncbi:hypothetical protein ACI65C_006835 [Semiaphis heraclei]